MQAGMTRVLGKQLGKTADGIRRFTQAGLDIEQDTEARKQDWVAIEGRTKAGFGFRGIPFSKEGLSPDYMSAGGIRAFYKCGVDLAECALVIAALDIEVG
jgi:hypothetical protein